MSTSRLAAAILAAILLGMAAPMAAGWWLMDHAPSVYLVAHQEKW